MCTSEKNNLREQQDSFKNIDRYLRYVEIQLINKKSSIRNNRRIEIGFLFDMFSEKQEIKCLRVWNRKIKVYRLLDV